MRGHQVVRGQTMTTYITVAEDEGAEPIELPTEDDGTGKGTTDS